MNIEFIDLDHKNNIKHFKDKLYEPLQKNREYLSAIYLLSKAHHSYIEYIELNCIRFTDLFEGYQYNIAGSGERALVKLAAHLFNNQWEIDLISCMSSLDENNLEAAFKAMEIRFHR